MRAFVYTRQSLDRSGEGAAVSRQLEDCMKLCASRDWEVTQAWTDNDVSASSTKPRPQYTAMLAAIERGEADVLVAWHVDRLTRKLTDLEHLIELAQATGLRIATVTGDIDLSTDAGRLVGRILASVARGEVERKGARQRRAQQQAAELGKPAGGRRAFGYAANGMDIIESEAALIRAAYQDVINGASLKSLARRWNEHGVATTAGGRWRHDNVRGVLRNPRYAGLRAYRGEVVGPAAWSPLIDAHTFDTVEAILSAPARRTTDGTARKHLLPGIALCWKCGSDLATGHTQHGVRVYVCRAKKCVSRAAVPIDELVENVVISRLQQSDAACLLAAGSDPNVSAELRSRAAALRQRIDDLAVGLEEGILTLAAVRRSSKRLRAELTTTEAMLAALSSTDVLTPLVEAPDVAAAWNDYDLQQKRAVIDTLMTVTVLAAKRGRQKFDPATVRIDWR